MCRGRCCGIVWVGEDDGDSADMVANAGRKLLAKAPLGLWRRIVGGDTVVFLGEENVCDELRDVLLEE